MNIEESKKYLIDNGLEFLFKLKSSNSLDEGTIEIDSNDLCRIHKIIRERKPFTTMEFGVGFSTIVIAQALYQNQQEWDNLDEVPKLRNSKKFKHYSVDTSSYWLNQCEKLLPNHLSKYVNFHASDCHIKEYNGQLCHVYNNLPNIIAEFIYLDGPDPKEVKGNINGLSFDCDERTVMSADLLLMESTFLPGTFILVDGRTNNSRFLSNNFKRLYKTTWDKKGDVTTFELDEEKLGKYNILGPELY
jgi:hypothetical protein